MGTPERKEGRGGSTRKGAGGGRDTGSLCSLCCWGQWETASNVLGGMQEILTIRVTVLEYRVYPIEV